MDSGPHPTSVFADLIESVFGSDAEFADSLCKGSAGSARLFRRSRINASLFPMLLCIKWLNFPSPRQHPLLSQRNTFLRFPSWTIRPVFIRYRFWDLLISFFFFFGKLSRQLVVGNRFFTSSFQFVTWATIYLDFSPFERNIDDKTFFGVFVSLMIF